MRHTLGLLYSVFKIRISVSITLCALAGIAVTPGIGLTPWQVAALALAVLTASASAGAFNHYVERDLDVRMARTRSRPFVTGRFQPGLHWLTAILCLLVAAVLAAAFATNFVAALYVFLGAFTYGVVYTIWLKRRTWLNIVLGGLAGSFAVLAGAAAVEPGLATAPIILAIVLFLWTPPHFWSLAFVYRDQYIAAEVPMLPCVIEPKNAARVILAHTITLVALSLVPFWYGLGWIYLAAAIVGGVYFIQASYRLSQRPNRVNAKHAFTASLGQLSLLLIGAIVDAILIG
ncbi:MAG: heme o synthase [Arenicellales bacterium]|nr:heme o synthase [Arenicellales bacterium]